MLHYIKEACLIVGFLLSWTLISRIFRVPVKEDANGRLSIKIPSSRMGYLRIVSRNWLLFFLVFGFSLLAGYLGTFLSIVIFVALLAFLIVQSVRGLLTWVFYPNPMAQFLNHIAAIALFDYIPRHRKLGFLLKFSVRHILMRRKIEASLMKQALTETERTLRERGPEAKEIMKSARRLLPFMSEIWKATEQTEPEGIISLQKKFIIAFFVTLVVVLLGFSSVAWNLHILDIYQLVDKDGIAVHNFLLYFYFTMITVSTVGYGDVVPGNDLARIISIVEIFTGFFLIVIVIASFTNITMKLYRIQREWFTQLKRQKKTGRGQRNT